MQNIKRSFNQFWSSDRHTHTHTHTYKLDINNCNSIENNDID